MNGNDELTTQWYAQALAANPKATAEDFARLYRCRAAGKFVQDPIAVLGQK